MPKDLKIGILVGVALAAVAAVWVSTRPSLSIEAKVARSHGAEPGRQSLSQAPVAKNTQSEPETTTIEKRDDPHRPAAKSRGSFRTEQTQGQRFHIVQPGDTLTAIAKEYYGSGRAAERIYKANRHLIKNINNIKPGTRLAIPE